ncbi:hypothetical protein ABW12_04440 [Pluralibacter gergoviae]|nr:hypothetical protein ABW12_04440 [Pluralibacter gergoviae]
MGIKSYFICFYDSPHISSKFRIELQTQRVKAKSIWFILLVINTYLYTIFIQFFSYTYKASFDRWFEVFPIDF